MNQQIVEKLVKYLEGSEDFLLEQAPDIITQALRYEKISLWSGLSLVLVFLVVSLCSGWFFYKNPNLDQYGIRSSSSLLGILFSIPASLLLFCQTCYFFDRLLQLYVAPKLYLIKMIMSLK